MSKTLTCIVCPNGCELHVDGENISGYKCPRGLTYAKEELFAPKRMVTSSVKILGSDEVCSVKTSTNVPKEKMFEIIKEINKISLKRPIKYHQIVIKNVLGLGVDIISTKEFD